MFTLLIKLSLMEGALCRRRTHHEAWTSSCNVTDRELRSVTTLPTGTSFILGKHRRRNQRRNEQQRHHRPNQNRQQLQPGRRRLRAQSRALSGRQQRRSFCELHALQGTHSGALNPETTSVIDFGHQHWRFMEQPQRWVAERPLSRPRSRTR